MKSKTFYVSFLSVGLAVGMIFSYVETLLPLNLIFPGFKLGLANTVTLLLLRRFGFREALLVNLARILLSSLLFGNAMSLVFSLAGGVIALILEWIMLKFSVFGILGVSSAGGAIHNLAQTVAAALILSTAGIMKLSPILLLLGGFTGILCGIVLYYAENLLRISGAFEK